MSIRKRVSDTFAKLIAGDPESAMFQICSAIEETAKRESGRGGRASYKSFLFANTDIICGIGVGVMLSGIRVAYLHPEITTDASGTCGLEDIVYHAVRCGLYHSAALPTNIRFTKNQIGPDGNGILCIPETIISGLAFSVVVSPANGGERSDLGHFIGVKGTEFHVNDWWGRATDFRAALNAALAKDSVRAEETT
jgi:hypothetical protein